MKKLLIGISILALAVLGGCAKAPQKVSSKPTMPKQAHVSKDHQSKTKEKKSELDPQAVEKALLVFEPAVKNDSKKAKVAYGRASRFLPVPIQFAMDLKLNNYVHALSILPQAGFSKEKQEFWDGVLKLKFQGLSWVVCSKFKNSKDVYGQDSNSYQITPESVQWVEKFNEKLSELAKDQRKPDPRQEGFQPVLDKLPCENLDGFSVKCQAIPDDLQKEVMNDKFFDNMRNAQRRDTRFYLWNSHDQLKRVAYERSVQPGTYLKLFEALKVTTSPKTSHFIHRLKGIAREIRSQDLWARAVGDLILEDKKDQEFSRRLENFKADNSVEMAVTGIETELAACRLSLKKGE